MKYASHGVPVLLVRFLLVVVEERCEVVRHEHLAELLIIGDDVLLRAPDTLDGDVGPEDRVRVAGVDAGRQVGAEDVGPCRRPEVMRQPAVAFERLVGQVEDREAARVGEAARELVVRAETPRAPERLERRSLLACLGDDLGRVDADLGCVDARVVGEAAAGPVLGAEEVGADAAVHAVVAAVCCDDHFVREDLRGPGGWVFIDVSAKLDAVARDVVKRVHTEEQDNDDAPRLEITQERRPELSRAAEHLRPPDLAADRELAARAAFRSPLRAREVGVKAPVDGLLRRLGRAGLTCVEINQ